MATFLFSRRKLLSEDKKAGLKAGSRNSIIHAMYFHFLDPSYIVELILRQNLKHLFLILAET